MSNTCKFKAQAIGAAVRLDRVPLKNSIPAVAVSALPEVGGRSAAKVEHVCFHPKEPGKGQVFEARSAETLTTGAPDGNSTAHCLVKQATLFGRIRARLVQVNVDRAESESGYRVFTHDNKLDGLRLDKYAVKFTIDEGPFNNPQTTPKKAKGSAAPSSTSIIRDISFPKGQPEGVTIDGHTILWPGFGTIFLGEICGDEKYRQITMIRVELEGSKPADPTRGSGEKAMVVAFGDGGSGGGGSVGSVGNGSP